MNYYEFSEPYFAIIMAKDEEIATKRYIEWVAGEEESEFDEILESCELVPEYYAATWLARALNEDGEPFDFKTIHDIFESNESELIVVDGSLC